MPVVNLPILPPCQPAPTATPNNNAYQPQPNNTSRQLFTTDNQHRHAARPRDTTFNQQLTQNHQQQERILQQHPPPMSTIQPTLHRQQSTYVHPEASQAHNNQRPTTARAPLERFTQKIFDAPQTPSA